MSYTISSNITNSSYLNTTGIVSITGSGTIITGFNCNCLRQGDINTQYTSSGEFYLYNGVEYIVYISKTNKPFIWVYSKNNLKYRKYLK